MSFVTGLSGLKGSKTELNAVGNNVANAGTTAFKKSRVEFGDVYSNSYFSSGRTDTGSGVTVERVAQLKTQGHTSETSKPLDMAIDGRGFFVIKQNGVQMYTRDGTFRINKDGYVTDNTDGFLQGYRLDSHGNIASSLGNIHIEHTNIVAKATSQAELEFNLDYRSATKDLETEAFNPKDPTTYNYVNVMKIYDSMGGEHDLKYYFVKTGEYETFEDAKRNGIENGNLKYPATVWTVFTQLDEEMFDAQGNIYEPEAKDQAKNAQMTLAYDSNGLLQGMARGGSHLQRVLPAGIAGGGALPLTKGTNPNAAEIKNAQPAASTEVWKDGVITYKSTIDFPANAAGVGDVTSITGPGFDDPAGGKLHVEQQGTVPQTWKLTLFDGTDQVGVDIITSTNSGQAVFTKPDGSMYTINYANLDNVANGDITFTETPHFTYTPKDTGVPEEGVYDAAANTIKFYGGNGSPGGFEFEVSADAANVFVHGSEFSIETEAKQTGDSTLSGFSAKSKFKFDMSKLTQGATYGQLDKENVGDDIIDMTFRSTQTARDSQFSAQSQDGYPPGEIRQITTSRKGIMSIHYTNNQTRDIAKIPLATFRNEDGLRPIGSNSYVETMESGSATINDAAAGPNGEIKDQHLELSNVDLAEELVRMIIAQRNFQANAKTIQTEDSITQTIINLR